MHQEPQIVFENVVKYFGDVAAVQKMNLSIQKGEFIAIMGSSGCGKTTTLRMLAGMETPTEGEIRLNGERINELKPSERNTPMVWQSLALFPFLNVIENVEFGLKMRGIETGERRRRALEWLSRMEIEEFADRSIDQLSGGQRQRVALARALVTEPPVLLLDEPLSALDANLVVRMQGMLSRLQKELGITFVYVTHSQSEAFAMADRVVIMSKGVIEQIGTPQEVYRKPASQFVANFVGSNNILSGSLQSMDGSSVTIDTEIGLVQANLPVDRACLQGSHLGLVISADAMSLSVDDDSSNSSRTHINQTHADQPSDNQFRCRLISEEFVGAMVTLLVETDSGFELRIQLFQKELDQIGFSESASNNGTFLWVSWSRESVYILP
ncbi:MAG: ATP-binding cassette domain-containing protein [Gammaproteobacteria bacterium]|nr:ATP-binding cassette domain-containing protein [Gammaproteobacteria bacterium]NKB62976.1 ATP-binding cassette domain-containing protein [Gammaproteobacteria bacterium]